MDVLHPLAEEELIILDQYSEPPNGDITGISSSGLIDRERSTKQALACTKARVCLEQEALKGAGQGGQESGCLSWEEY